MHPTNITKLLAIIVFFSLFTACKKNDTTSSGSGNSTDSLAALNLPTLPFNYSNIVFPAHIQQALNSSDNTPATNPITNWGATLGRVLFYDKNLSFNKSISCASCHIQSNGFRDTSQFSEGFEGGFTTRTAMNTLNLRFYASGKMFWDERANSVEQQVLMPVVNHVEMGMTIPDLVNRLKTLPYYPVLFRNAFGASLIDSAHISRALAQFMRTIVTYQAKYDLVKQGMATFTPAEQQGENLFLTAQPPGGGPTCATCHTPPMFMNSAAPPFTLPDPNDLGINNQRRFKSGSLRNIATAKNLFHNGSIANIQAMLNGTNGAVPAHTVAPPDRANLLAFLNTLTDNTIASEVKFSNPFK